MKFGICNEIFQGWKLEDAMAFAKGVGYDGIELAPYTIAKYVNEISQPERHRIRIAAERIGIEVVGIHWVLVQAEGMYLTHPDKEVRTRTSEYFCDLVDFCADIGGRIIVVGSPKQRNVIEGVGYEQAWQWATEVFKNPVELAFERGVVVCLEPLSPGETNFITKAEEAIKFINQFNNPAFRLILDVKAMSSETKPIPLIIKDSAEYLAHFHANDKNLKGPGFGDIDFHPIARALKEVGYNGYVSVEVFKFDEGPQEIASRSIQYLKKVFTSVYNE
ncbi:MAG: sugar phosphate isomerase/epimerase family protein [Verrucomicrobiia bacterium]|jgi:sugar phosphate isomerase/epimerase